jgi:iron-sulfur cluster assembly protein/iron-sulfur cluster insertion protein
MSVTLTDKAITKIKEFFAQDKALEGKQLRVYVETGGCSGYSYAFKFDDAAEQDAKQPYDGFNVVIDPNTEKLINGATIDYKEDFGQEGFAISNPNAKKSCGCGNSFEV